MNAKETAHINQRAGIQNGVYTRSGIAVIPLEAMNKNRKTPKDSCVHACIGQITAEVEIYSR